MKVVLLALLVAIAASGVVACKKEAGLTTTQLIELVYKQTTTIRPSGAGTAQTTLTELSDSRCPSDVVCFTGGNISLTVVLTDATGPQTARLGYVKSYAQDSVQVTLNSQTYWLRLLTVTPYPSTKNGNQVKTAVLRLRPR